jgi:hypothetical protein
LLGLTPGDATSAIWTIDCVPVSTAAGFDLKGPYIQGPPGARFIYLSWGTVDDAKNFELFRRAKLWLDCIPSEVLVSAVDQGLLVGRLGLYAHPHHMVSRVREITPGQWRASDILA